MRLTDYRNTTEQEVKSKKHNIWIGISLGNKYFNKENLTDYIKSSLGLSREGILVIIADTPQTINYEVFENLKPENALAKAQRNGDKIMEVLNEIVFKLPENEQDKVKIVRWGDISKTPWYQKYLATFRKAFDENIDFKNKLVEIVKLNLGDRIDGLDDKQIEKLAIYVLEELPIFMGMGSIKIDTLVYDLHIYPGLSLMDDFILELQEKAIFPEIMKDINIENKLSIAEAYAEENVVIKETATHGKSIFANKPFHKDEIIFEFSGPITNKPTIYTIPIDYDTYMDDQGTGKYLCHSCNPSCGIKDRKFVVAMRDIEKGKEINIDYAMFVPEYRDEMTEENRICKCGESNCRGKLGCFKELPNDIKEKYKGYISDYLLK